MSTHTLLKTARFLSLTAGAALTISGQQMLFANLLSGPGSLVVNNSLRAAAPLAEDAASGGTVRFVMGAAFLMAGLMAHALLGVHKQDQVRITVVPKKRKPAKEAKWFWIEMRV